MKKNKSNGMKLLAVISAGTLAAGLIGCGTKTSPKTDATETKTEGFVPSLDTEKSVSLETARCLGNFEALDQVINAFNEFLGHHHRKFRWNEKTRIKIRGIFC